MKEFDDIFILELIGSGVGLTENGAIIGYLEYYNSIDMGEISDNLILTYQGRPVIPVYQPVPSSTGLLFNYILVPQSRYRYQAHYVPDDAIYVHSFISDIIHPQQIHYYDYCFFNNYGLPVKSEEDWKATVFQTVIAYWQRLVRKVNEII